MINQKEMLPLQPGDVPVTYADVNGPIEDFEAPGTHTTYQARRKLES